MNNLTFFRDRGEMRLLASLGVVIFLLIIISFLFQSKVRRGDESTPTRAAVSSFKNIELEARAVYVYDTRTKEVLYAKNENTRMPLASLTKVMGGLVALEIAPPNSVIVIDGEALKVEGDSGLLPGEKWILEDLLDFTLTTSSNDGIQAVAIALGALDQRVLNREEIVEDFIGRMNKKAGDLGMKNTYYLNTTGLDLSSELDSSVAQGGAFGTAKDMVLLFDYVLNNEPRLLESTRESRVTTNSLDKAHIARNTNDITGLIPGLLGSKTGYTNIAGGNLVVVFDPELGRPIIISVLGSSASGRFEDMEKLIEKTLEEISKE